MKVYREKQSSKFQLRLEELEKNCIKQAPNNPEEYVKCRNRFTKNYEFNQKLSFFKLDYYRKKAIVCMEKNARKRQELDPCRIEAVNAAQGVMKDLYNSIN